MPQKKTYPPVYFDLHMHFCSGHCSPLPLLWEKQALLKHGEPGRDFIDSLASIPEAFGIGDEFFRVALMRTDVIGEEWAKLLAAMEKFSVAKVKKLKLADSEDFKKAFDKLKSVGKYPDELLCISVVHTMDMDFGHIRGYFGYPIYDFEKAKLEKIVRDGKLIEWKSTYKYRKNNVVRGKGKTPVICRSSKPKRSSKDGELLQEKSAAARKKKAARGYENWSLQKERTQKVAYDYPFSALPFYHYDPRRYIQHEQPEAPFSKVITAGQNQDKSIGPYVGFKLYTALGYRPLETIGDSPYNNLDISHLSQKDKNNIERFKQGFGKVISIQEDFYSKCEKEKIPVLCHCSPSGMYTHDRTKYAQFFADKKTYKIYKDKKARYFNNNYVHPTAWHRVLKKYPKLNLCLAHWGGIDNWKAFSSDWRNWRTTKAQYSNKGTYAFTWIDAAVKLVYAYDNLYLDLSYLPLFELFDAEKKDKLKLQHPPEVLATSPEAKTYRAWKTRMKKYSDKGLQWDYLSYLLEKDKQRGGKLRKRLLWGTDWYMFGTDFESYGEYIAKMLDSLKKVQKRAGIKQNLLHQFSLVNNSRYMNLNGIAKPLLDHFSWNATGAPELKTNLQKNKWRADALEKLLPDEMQEQLDANGELSLLST